MSLRSAVARGAIITALLAATGLAGAGLSAVNPAPAHASAVTTWTWDQRTGAAFHAYEHHKTSRNFAAMAADATHADTYLRVDVGTWARDRAHRASPATLWFDGYYVWADVTQPAD